MNIGFEAKRAYTNNTGLGHYSRTLISSLATFYNKHQYFLFTPKQSSLFNTAHFNNIKTIVPTSFPSNILKSVWRSNWIKKDLKNNDIQLYHGLSHEIPLGIQHTNIATVVTMHDLIFERYPEQYKPIDVRIYRAKFINACKNANKIIAISNQTKSDLIDLYKVDEQKIAICYQSCNTAFNKEIPKDELLRIKQLYNLPSEFFLYVGSIIERKNLLLICKALKLLQQKINIPLVVIGDGGDYKKQVQQFIAKNGLDKHVIFLSDKFKNDSFRNASDFPAIYQQAIAMIYPSVYEGFGVPVLEALCSKLPVITSNVSCMPETGGNAALYVNPYKETELANAMEEICLNPTLRNSMIEKGILHATNFTQQKCASDVFNVYKQLVNIS
jgi:glycosyltransferase involved in cell wall biosynthesis